MKSWLNNTQVGIYEKFVKYIQVGIYEKFVK